MSENLLNGMRLLVVDDEEIIRDFFFEALTRRNVDVTTCSDGVEARDLLERHQFDLVITDYKMPNMNGMELLEYILGSHPTIPVIMFTAYGTIEGAVEAMRAGAFDYLKKPLDRDLNVLVEIVLKRAFQHRRLLVEIARLQNELIDNNTFDNLVGPGPEMQRIRKLLSTVAPTQATVLIQGESGTGKELVARAIHYNSPRAKGPFIKVNCAALPEGLIESELFGHEKGAFTGAIKTTRGKFEAANGGTLLLDEIGEMPKGLQAKLLRILQEREFQRVGSNENVKIDIRILATTNIDLDLAIREKRFRKDLFYRLNVIPIKLPSLSQRRGDIPALAYHFLRKYCRMHKRNIKRISNQALSYLSNSTWSGNVRELENAIERAVILCRGGQLEPADFFVYEDRPESVVASPFSDIESAPEGSMTIAELEKQHILRTLKAKDGHRAHTAEALGISIRTLRNKLNEYRQVGENI